VLAILAMLAKERCAWLRVAALLSSPPLRATALAESGRDGKARAAAEPESPIERSDHEATGDIPIWGNEGQCYISQIQIDLIEIKPSDQGRYGCQTSSKSSKTSGR
jgi:hypothetical protein